MRRFPLCNGKLNLARETRESRQTKQEDHDYEKKLTKDSSDKTVLARKRGLRLGLKLWQNTRMCESPIQSVSRIDEDFFERIKRGKISTGGIHVAQKNMCN